MKSEVSDLERVSGKQLMQLLVLERRTSLAGQSLSNPEVETSERDLEFTATKPQRQEIWFLALFNRFNNIRDEFERCAL